VNRGIDLGNHFGLFLLSVRPDGTVASVKVLQSLVVRELDERAIGRLSRMKFRPGSITEARVPLGSFSFKTH
jgi:outer membrane biosynthesis protein TonB